MGRILTFYSYKGGTGRSMALANVGWTLATQGQRVLLVDFDLEAPGLHRYLSPFLQDSEMVRSFGVCDLMLDFIEASLDQTPEARKSPEEWFEPLQDYLPYVSHCNTSLPEGRLDLMPAGKQGASYTERANQLDWTAFYQKLGGAHFLRALAERWRRDYDYILIDSRTGVSDTSGICMVELPDALVVLFTLNVQSIRGAAAVAKSASELRGKQGVQVFPVVTRVEDAEVDKRDRMMKYARRLFDPVLSQLCDETTGKLWDARNKALYWDQVEIKYHTYFAYEEVLSACVDASSVTSLQASFERLIKYLTRGWFSSAAPLDRGCYDRLRLQFESVGVLHEDAETSSAYNPTQEELTRNEHLAKRERLRQFSAAWIAAGAPKDGLPRGSLLAYLRELPIEDSPSNKAANFVEACQKAELEEARREIEAKDRETELLDTKNRLAESALEYTASNRRLRLMGTGGIFMGLCLAGTLVWATIQQLERREQLQEQVALVKESRIAIAHNFDQLVEEKKFSEARRKEEQLALKKLEKEEAKAKETAANLQQEFEEQKQKGEKASADQRKRIYELHRNALEAKAKMDAITDNLELARKNLEQTREEQRKLARELARASSEKDRLEKEAGIKQANLQSALIAAVDERDRLRAKLATSEERANRLERERNLVDAERKEFRDALERLRQVTPTAKLPF